MSMLEKHQDLMRSNKVNYLNVVIVGLALFIASAARGTGADSVLSETAQQGKAQFSVCLSCHNESLNPAKAPPMFGVQNRYKRQHDTEEAFVNALVDFVTHPTEDKALMKRAVKKLGLMPALPLGEETLGNIAAYIYETSFDAPCEHWKAALSSNKDQDGKGQHRRQVERNYANFCE